MAKTQKEVQDKLNERQASVEEVDFGDTIKIPKNVILELRYPDSDITGVIV